jgi:hypothetical protein
MDDYIDFAKLGETLDAIWTELNRMKQEVEELNRPESREIERGLEASTNRLKGLYQQMSLDLGRTAAGLQIIAAALGKYNGKAKPIIRLIKH